MIDLHLHSNHSDGFHTIEFLVDQLHVNNINYSALTDHDTVSGVEEFIERTRDKGLHSASGVEITAEYDKNSTFHILGYGIDISNVLLLETLKQPVVSCEEAIRTIKQAGGYAVWAHPGFECHINVIRFRVEELIEYGLDGLEAFHYMNLPDAVKGCVELAQKYNLMITAGSDFHSKSLEQVGKIDFYRFDPQKVISKTMKKIFSRAL
jgi:predicted metal-dependent phosphoesterase TrpH